LVTKPNKHITLGQYLEQARQAVGMSHRQLAAASGIHPSSINRLLKDEVDEPSPEHLVSIAEALDVKASDLFVLAGLPIPKELPSVDVMLRAEYGLSEQGLIEAKRQIAAIARAEQEKHHT
jgi:transcriptional regulator with XRE-family HTH domain